MDRSDLTQAIPALRKWSLLYCFIPPIPKTKFYDFPLSFAEWIDDCIKNKLKPVIDYVGNNGIQSEFFDFFGAKEWHEGCMNWLELKWISTN